MPRIGHGAMQLAEPIEANLYMWALVDSIQPFGDARGSALVLSLDAMATETRENLRNLSPREPRCLRRVSFWQKYDGPHGPHGWLTAEPMREGDWLRITIGPRSHRGPSAIVEGPFTPLLYDDAATNESSAATAVGEILWLRRATRRESSELASRCALTTPTNTSFGKAHIARVKANRVRVHDVGQANCATIYKDTKIVGFFDVGRPLFFNSNSSPGGSPLLTVPKKGFVALSHWDYDHYAMALTSAPALLRLDWIAPAPARPGPTVTALINRLGTRIRLESAPIVAIGPNVALYKCNGPPSDRNNSGYVMHIASPEGAKLLTGDAAYGHIPSRAKKNVRSLLITHHGGSWSGTPPSPRQGTGVAAVSFGNPNCYQHPDASQLTAHTRIGWTVIATNWTGHPALAPAKATKGATRGDVWL